MMNDEPQQRWEQLIYPETQGIKNLLGIKDPTHWEKIESRLTTARIVDLPYYGFTGDTVAEELSAYHRTIFQDCYAWAGQFRTVDMSKDNLLNGGRTVFAHWQTIPQRLDELNGIVDSLGDAQFDDAVSLLAYLHSELNEIHPFREGNGRTTRTYMSYLAQRHDIIVDWDAAGTAQHYAAIVSMLGDELNHTPWHALYKEICAPATWEDEANTTLDEFGYDLSTFDYGQQILNTLGLSTDTAGISHHSAPNTATTENQKPPEHHTSPEPEL
ncbi:MAG: Fic family protein [Corynebacterium sp.]|nr:Fic family protein [Corynebacterium sp.]